MNAAALRRVERLFCRNERATLRCRLLPSGQLATLVPIAAILVASLRLHFLDLRLHLDYDGPQVIGCDHELKKGEEIGWFEHGSTILVFAPAAMRFCDAVVEGARIRMGESLFRLPTQERRARVD